MIDSSSAKDSIHIQPGAVLCIWSLDFTLGLVHTCVSRPGFEAVKSRYRAEPFESFIIVIRAFGAGIHRLLITFVRRLWIIGLRATGFSLLWPPFWARHYHPPPAVLIIMAPPGGAAVSSRIRSWTTSSRVSTAPLAGVPTMWAEFGFIPVSQCFGATNPSAWIHPSPRWKPGSAPCIHWMMTRIRHDPFMTPWRSSTDAGSIHSTPLMVISILIY